MVGKAGLEQRVESGALVGNPQEAVVGRLLQEGLLPEDIANLKSMHIDAEGRFVQVHRKGGLRPHPISKACMQLIDQALQQTAYPVRQADGAEGYARLLPGDYVVKVSLCDYVGNEAFIPDPAAVRLRAVYSRLRKLDIASYGIAAEAVSIDLVS